MLRPTPRHLLAPALATALLLSACGAGETTDAPTSTPTETTAAPTASATTPAGDDGTTTEDATPADQSGSGEDRDPAAGGGDVPDLGDHCTVPVDLDQVDRVEFAAPSGWRVGDACEFFDPAVEQVEPATEPDVAISVDVTDTPYHEAAASGPETRDEVRHVGARSGYQAVRVRAQATGRGLYPEGMPQLTYLVDLDPGTDDAGGTLVLGARPSEAADFALAAEALDRMIDTVRVVPVAEDVGEAAVVSRVEGGGTPWTVTVEAGCVRLHAGGPDGGVVDEACELGAPDDSIQAAVLEGDGLQVVAGLAPPRATLVESDAASAPYGSITQPMEGATAFAHAPVDVPVEVRALDAEGQRLATATVD